MNNTFSLAIAQQIVDDVNQFPVDFNMAWEWLDYSAKDKAKRALLGCGFTADIDFTIKGEPTTTGIQANPKQTIYLTVDCLKMWSMMAGTEKGKQVRLYFLECEKIAKAKAPTYAQSLRLLADEVEAKELVEKQLKFAQAQIDVLEEEVDLLFDYSSIIRVAKENKCDEKAFNWRSLKAASRMLELEIKSAPCPRYGTKNLYSREAWEYVYPEYKLPAPTTLVNG